MDRDKDRSMMEIESDIVEVPEASKSVHGNKSGTDEEGRKASQRKNKNKLSNEPIHKRYDTRKLSGKNNRRQEYVYYQSDTVKKKARPKVTSRHVHPNKKKSQGEADKLIEDIVQACKKLEKLGKDFILILTDEKEDRWFGCKAGLEFLEKKQNFLKEFSSACREKRKTPLAKFQDDKSISRRQPLLKIERLDFDGQRREREPSEKLNQELKQDIAVEQESSSKEDTSTIKDDDMNDTSSYGASPLDYKFDSSDTGNSKQLERISNPDVNMPDDHVELEAESDEEKIKSEDEDVPKGTTNHAARSSLNKWFNLNCGEAKDVVVKDETSGIVKYVPAKTDLDIHICQKCGLFFMNALHLMSHRARILNCEQREFKTPLICDDSLSCTVTIQNPDQPGSTLSVTMGKLLESLNSPPFVCPVCNTTWKKFCGLKRHLKTHFKSASYVCSICGSEIQTLNGFRKHMTRHFFHPYDCLSCSKRFSSQAELEVHSKSKCQYSVQISERHVTDVDGIEDVKCKTCGYQALNRTSLLIHESQHIQQKNVHCVICKKLLTRQHMKRHYLLMHEDQTPFSCEICGKQFKDRLGYRRHKKLHEEKHPCTKCDKVFNSKTYLAFHMRTHTNEKRFVCQHCGRGYNTKNYLDNHLRLHTGERPYKCTFEGCDKAFRSAFNLKQHTRSHCEVGQYVCDICGRTFKQPGKLNAHRKGHFDEFRWPCAYCPEKFGSCWKYKRHLANNHGEKKEEIERTTNIRLHKCKMCDKIYHDKEDLRRHMNNHNGIKPFVCKYCNKAFSDKSNLHTHTLRHIGKTRLRCKDCYKTFLLEKNLIAHMKRVHGEQNNTRVEETDTSLLDLALHVKGGDGSFYEIEVVPSTLQGFDNIE